MQVGLNTSIQCCRLFCAGQERPDPDNTAHAQHRRAPRHAAAASEARQPPLVGRQWDDRIAATLGSHPTRLAGAEGSPVQPQPIIAVPVEPVVQTEQPSIVLMIGTEVSSIAPMETKPHGNSQSADVVGNDELVGGKDGVTTGARLADGGSKPERGVSVANDARRYCPASLRLNLAV